MTSLTTRIAVPEDVPAMAAIYSKAVLETVVTWEYDPPSEAEFLERLHEKQEAGYPWYVAVIEDEVVGYAYAGPHRARYGYRFTAEVSIYVRHNQKGRGVGKLLYARLFENLKHQGYVTLVAGYTIPNPESELFHEKQGFKRCAEFINIGYKFGEMRSSAFGQMQINPAPPTLEKPILTQELSADITSPRVHNLNPN